MVRVAIFGASRGCAHAMVAQGLAKGDHTFKLLIRKPENLDFTEDQKAKLTIIEGDANDAVAVKQTIVDTEVIVYSIGSAFITSSRTMVSPGLCRDTMTVILQVIEQLAEEERPKRLIAVSSTGLNDMSEVPLLFRPIYKLLLHEPHQDKKELERLVSDNSFISNWILVRPSLLTDGKLEEKYRADEGISGYTISRLDVGHFLLNQCLVPTTWLNKKVVVTY
ncbi:hypothetical protein EDC94DRAFT_327175 [Helicostylum pulchrum]|uniref:NAD(P)-binding domain-containing protein n=1 Tax=Helicostylum pulchrum TaxID=562976 RepID=A0ABP9Y3T6_9FUNG|nr:hypothetical protein EDC94DRAFT_327175 [Helicostylum pulchrum]